MEPSSALIKIYPPEQQKELANELTRYAIPPDSNIELFLRDYQQLRARLRSFGNAD